MTPPLVTDDVPASPWPSELPDAPPYVDGPLTFPDPATFAPRPLTVTTRSAPRPATPPAAPSRAPWRTAVLILSALALFAASVFVTRALIESSASSSTAAPSVSTPSTSTPPTTRRSTPSTSTPSSPSTVPDASGNGSTTPDSTPAGTPDLTAQAAIVTPGIVDILSRLPAGVGAGTGIVISDTGDVITNNHVVEGATQIQATVTTNGEVYSATVVGTDPENDVAVLHLAGAKGLATVPIGDSDTVQVGDEVAAVGNAGGVGGAPNVAGGRVIALHEPVTAADETGGQVRTLTDLIEVDAFVQPGDSGGPLVSADAKVIGIDVAAGVARSRTGARTHVGFAIPINRVMRVAKQIQANPTGPSAGSTAPALGSGFLGVSAIDAVGTPGAAISSVQPRSPAATAGLQADDVITKVDDTTITDANDLVAALGRHKGGDQVTITWQSADGEHQATVTLASR